MTIDFPKERWDCVRENARLWWEGRLGRPLIQIRLNGADPGRPKAKLPFRHFTAQYGLDAPVADVIDSWDCHLSSQRYLGDAFPVVFNNFGPGILAAFLGARVQTDQRTVWFHPAQVREIADLNYTYDPESPWLRRIKDLCRAAGERWEGQVLISMTDLGGNLDVLSTFRPSERLPLDLLLEPEHVKRLTWEGHELWFRAFDEINAVLQPVNPGHSAWAPIYSEVPSYMLQCDFCYMIGPRHFDEFVKPELAASCRRIDNAFYHLDGPGQLAHLDSLLEIPDLDGVQWIPGDGQKPMSGWPEVYRRIHRAGKRIQLMASGVANIAGILDAVAEQIGTADGIVMIGAAPAAQEAEAVALLKRYGAL